MPTQIELDFPIGYVADQLAAFVGGESAPRAPGWHLTALLDASTEMAKGKDIDPNDYWCSEEKTDGGDLADKLPPGLLEMGHLWEAAARPALVDYFQEKFNLMVTGPTQMERDGIVANADALAIGQGRVAAIVECKFRYSADTDVKKQDKWMRQVKGYCHIWGTDLVYFAVGNVRSRPPGSGARIYMLQFTEKEIAENWQMLVNARTYLDKLVFDLDVTGQAQADLSYASDPSSPGFSPLAPAHVCNLDWAVTSGDFDCDLVWDTEWAHGINRIATVWCGECGRMVCVNCAVVLQQGGMATTELVDAQKVINGVYDFVEAMRERSLP
jgi:hypothetical protein